MPAAATAQTTSPKRTGPAAGAQPSPRRAVSSTRRRALVVERGVDALTTRDIAETAEAPVASLYQYFADKEDVLLALAERDIAEMDAQVAAGPRRGSRSCRSPSLVRTTMMAFVGVYHRRPAFVEIYLRGRTNLAVNRFGRDHNAPDRRDALRSSRSTPAWRRRERSTSAVAPARGRDRRPDLPAGVRAATPRATRAPSRRASRWSPPTSSATPPTPASRASRSASGGEHPRRRRRGGAAARGRGPAASAPPATSAVRDGDRVAVTGTGVVLAQPARPTHVDGRRSRAGVVLEGDAGADLRAATSTSGVYAGHRARARSCTPTRRTPRAVACVLVELPCSTTSSCCSAARSASRRTPRSARPSWPRRTSARARRSPGRADGQPRLGRRRRARSTQAVEHALLLEWLAALHHRATRARHAAGAHRGSSRPHVIAPGAPARLRHRPRRTAT